MNYDPDANVMIYDEVLHLSSGSYVVRNGKTYVHPSLANIQTLTKMGRPTVAPIRSYHWPVPQEWRDAAKLRPELLGLIKAEINTANFIVANPLCLVASEMRTGKTAAALWAADYLQRYWHERNKPFGVLVLCTKSTVRTVWEKHIDLLFGRTRSRALLIGSAAKRTKLIQEPHDFYIMNHDGVRYVDIEELPTNIRMIIVDEATAFKDGTTTRSAILQEWCARVDHVVLMSATPTPEGPINAHALGKLLRTTGGESYSSYERRVRFKIAQWTWRYTSEATAEAAKLLHPYIRYEARDVLPVGTRFPPELRYVDVSSEQLPLLKTMQKEFFAELANGVSISAVSEGAKRWKVLQILAGVLYETWETVDGDKVRKHTKRHNVDADGRLETVRDLVKECNGRVVIYAGLTGAIEALEKYLRPFNPRVIQGETTDKQRREYVDAFNAHKIGPLIAQPSAVAHGLDLAQGASTIIWYQPIDKAEVFAQANERIEGVNQRNPTQIFLVCCSGFEEQMYKRLGEKRDMQGLVLEFMQQLKDGKL